MKTFKIWVSVNDYEYTTTVTLYGEKIAVGDPFEMDNEWRYPVFVDDHMIAFDEYIVSIEEDGKEIYCGV